MSPGQSRVLFVLPFLLVIILPLFYSAVGVEKLSNRPKYTELRRPSRVMELLIFFNIPALKIRIKINTRIITRGQRGDLRPVLQEWI